MSLSCSSPCRRFARSATVALALLFSFAPPAPAQKQVATIAVNVPPNADYPARPVNFAFSPDGQTLAAYIETDKSLEVRLYDTKTRRHAGTLTLTRGSAWGMLAFTSDGKHLVVAGSPAKVAVAKAGAIRVQVWDLKAKKALREADFTGCVGGVGFILPGDKELLLCGWKAAARVRLDTLKEASRFTYRETGMRVDLSADGKLLAVSGLDGTLAVHETAKGKTVMSVEVEKPLPPGVGGGTKPGHYLPCAFAPDGKSVVVCKDNRFGELVVFSVPAGKKLASLLLEPGRRPSGTRLSFLPDGKTVLNAAVNAAGFSLVEPSTLMMTPIPVKGDAIHPRHYAFCPRTYLLATGDKDIRLWQLPKKAKDD